MLRYLLLLLVTAAALIAGPLVAGNKGYVLIAIGQYTIEMTVISACLLAVGLYVLLLITESLLSRLFGLRGATRRWVHRRRQRKTGLQLGNGLQALLEGRHAQAEKLLLASSAHGEEQSIRLLAAALAAHAQGASDRRDDYLQQVEEGAPQLARGLSLTRARLQQTQGDHEAAKQQLQARLAQTPDDPQLLAQLAAHCLASQDWPLLDSLLPRLAQRRVASQLGQVGAQLYPALLEAEAKDIDELTRRWEQLPKASRQQPEVVAGYVNRLLDLEARELAEQTLAPLLRKQPDHAALLAPIRRWDHPAPQLLAILQKVTTPNAAQALALGWLLLQQRDFPAARQQLEQALALQPSAAVYQALAQLMEQQRLFEKAATYYRLSLGVKA